MLTICMCPKKKKIRTIYGGALVVYTIIWSAPVLFSNEIINNHSVSDTVLFTLIHRATMRFWKEKNYEILDGLKNLDIHKLTNKHTFLY